MRALQVTGPRQVRLVEAPAPVPGPGEVVVRIRASGVCGSDLNAWRGVSGIDYPMEPGAPGHETVGDIVELGPHVPGLRLGQTVTGLLWNGFAELGLARAEDVLPVPAWLSDATVLGEPLACAMNVVRRAAIAVGDRVAIVGFGYLAALITQLLPPGIGPWVAISRRAESRELALQLGAAGAYDFGAHPADWWDRFPVVIEAAGVQQALDHATWLTAFGGRLVIAGYHADGPRTVNMQSWNWKGIDVINAHERQRARSVEALRCALDALATRHIPFAALHSHLFGLEDVDDAFRLAEERPAGFVKALVCPS